MDEMKKRINIWKKQLSELVTDTTLIRNIGSHFPHGSYSQAPIVRNVKHETSFFVAVNFPIQTESKTPSQISRKKIVFKSWINI